jgi:excisionase family DNA binding protein
MSTEDVQSVDSDSLLMTAEEIAKLLQVSVRSIWRLRSAEAIPRPLKIGGSIRWRRDDLLGWISAGCPSMTSRENRTRRK